jgi:hypothetical protein
LLNNFESGFISKRNEIEKFFISALFRKMFFAERRPWKTG